MSQNFTFFKGEVFTVFFIAEITDKKSIFTGRDAIQDVVTVHICSHPFTGFQEKNIRTHENFSCLFISDKAVYATGLSPRQ